MKLFRLSSVLFFALIVCVFHFPASSYCKVWRYLQLTDNELNDRNPRIHGNQVVWNGYNENGQYCLLHIDLDDMEINDLTTGLVQGHFGMPAIHNGLVAFRSYDRVSQQHYYLWDGNSFFEIYSDEQGSFPP